MIITVYEPKTNLTVNEQVITVLVSPNYIAARGEAGPQNLFIQADEPVYNAPFLWLKDLGNGKFDLRYGAGV